MNINPEYDEDNLKGKPVFDIKSLLPSIDNIPKKADPKIHSEEHDLAKQICDYFQEKKFGMWLGVIKRKGLSRVYRAFAEVRQSNAKTPARLLMWKLKDKKNEKETKSN